MRRPLAVALFTLGLIVVARPVPAQTAATPSSNRPARAWRPDESILAREPALPTPSLTEPFAIGEALHDPGRVEQAVVSLLAALGIQIIPDNPRGVLAIGDGRTLRLTQSEVRGLVAMGQADAEEQAQDPAGPYTFTDFHKGLASSLRGVSVEQLAGAYSMEYDQHPDRVAAQVLLGQPIEPDTPLLRTEMWLLLVDGLMAPGPGRLAARRRPRIVLARAQGGAVWTGDVGLLNRAGFMSPDGRRWADAIWAELAVRLPLALASSITLVPSGTVHEGHAGPGQTVTITAQFKPPTVTFEGGLGPVDLVPQQSTLAGTPASWATNGTIRKHAPNAPTQTPRAPLSGTPRLPLTPRAEAAKGRGVRTAEPGIVQLTVSLAGLVNRTYGLTGLSFPLSSLGSTTVKSIVNMEWHAADTLDIDIVNEYDVGSRLVGLTRSGTDAAIGTLALEPGGTYRGVVRLSMSSRITVPGKACSPNDVLAWQYADVLAVPIAETATSLPVSTPVAGPGSQGPPSQPTQPITGAQTSGAFYTSVRTRQGYTFTRGTPTRYFRLEFTPASSPQYVRLVPDPDPAKPPTAVDAAKDPCMDEIPACPAGNCGVPDFIPLNDAQWTIRGYGSVGGADTVNVAGYPIAAPEAKTADEPARLDYVEARTPENRDALSAIRLGGIVKADSKWSVTVIHTKDRDR